MTTGIRRPFPDLSEDEWEAVKWKILDAVVIESNGCWTRNQGGHNAQGYARVKIGGSWWLAHRMLYRIMVGDVAVEADLDHLCRNRGCVNPGHLEPVTRRENLIRGDTLTAAKAAQTHCVHGHEFTPENTRMRGPLRECRACRRERKHRYRLQKRGSDAI